MADVGEVSMLSPQHQLLLLLLLLLVGVTVADRRSPSRREMALILQKSQKIGP